MEQQFQHPLTSEEFAQEMQKLKTVYGSDLEAVHGLMDDLMCAQLNALGFSEGIKIFLDTHKWYA